MKMIEEVKRFSKEKMYENYTRIVESFKEYEKISKTKMIEAIYQVYDNPENIIDICTVRELKFLKMILDGKHEFSDQEKRKYRFEIENLKRKYLIWLIPSFSIPDEIYDKVSQALQQVVWERAKRKDRINEIVVGICRIHGEIGVEPLLQLSCPILGITFEDMNQHFRCNRLFKYYIYPSEVYIESINSEMPIFIYQDYYYILDELDEARRVYGMAHSRNVDVEEYINMFYYGFNINNSIVKKFYQKINSSVYYNLVVNLIQEVVLLNGSRELLEKYVGKYFEHDKKFSTLMNQALDEMPSGALNGATPKEAKYFRLEEEKNKYKKEINYVKQGNAHLSKKENITFYKVYFALLEYTNNLYGIYPSIKKLNRKTAIEPSVLIEIIEKFWEEKEQIIPRFLKDNPHHFNKYEMSIVEGMKKGFRDTFFLARYEKEYTCLLDENKCYMIKGLYDNIDNIISYQYLPCMVVTSIMPFDGKIISDGLFQSSEGISFGSDFESMVEEELEKSERVYQL